MSKLLVILLVMSFQQFALANEWDATLGLSECVWKKLPTRDSSWLSMAPSDEGSVSALREWSETVAEQVPEELKLGIALAGRRALAGSEFKLEQLNRYHDRLLEAFRSGAAGSLSIDQCGEKTEVADFLYAAIVDRFGADVRFAAVSVRSRFEDVTPLAKYYSGNALFVWVALKFSGVDISLERLLAQYSPSPERVRLFIEAE